MQDTRERHPDKNIERQRLVRTSHGETKTMLCDACHRVMYRCHRAIRVQISSQGEGNSWGRRWQEMLVLCIGKQLAFTAVTSIGYMHSGWG